ncbi:protein translocase subunit SecD [Suttonella sp. R2A3]|uniref:protein translocase subunit SecD n=1 Tax=Suttonella sp. R2A3 TaxID=2908648 RepID=UPI001F1C54E9|nr:protein translocase subunit SecD [Suttonella sp. R2A3]UJF24672.1 protein translocase subunit SecD [Suttonella sp. R2A3]
MPKPFALWKYALIAVVLAAGLIFALPNWYGKSPAVQMQFESLDVASAAATEVNNALAEANLNPVRWEQKDKSLNLLFADTDQQIAAKDLLTPAYPDAVVAINLLSDAPQWMQSFGLDPMSLGLDLRGGVSFLLQVDTQQLFERKSAELIDLTTSTLSDQGLSYLRAEASEQGGALLLFASEDERNAAQDAIFSIVPNTVERLNTTQQGQYGIQLRYTDEGIAAAKRKAAEQNRMQMSGRVDSLGVAEPSIQVVGDDRVLIQLPGIQDVAAAKEILGSTATLEFYLVDEKGDVNQAVRSGRAPFGTKLAYFEDGQPILLKRRVIMSGEHIVDASASYGQEGLPQVNVVLDSAGGAIMSNVTRDNINKPMATMYVEFVPETVAGEDGETTTQMSKREFVVNSATIRGQFSKNFQITGVEPITRARKLAATLRAGSLTTPVYIVEERTIGPSAGKQNIEQGTQASILGLLLVAVFMLLYYRKLGVFADIALTANIILLIALMSVLGATLTLPGIAGIILTLGMAVDANVLIYERIREELHSGLAVREAVRSGFDNAFSTIVDANVTTLIVAILLFSFGAGPIKGFAVTLSVGVLTSMFSAIYVTRALIEWFLLRREQPKLKM